MLPALEQLHLCDCGMTALAADGAPLARMLGTHLLSLYPARPDERGAVTWPRLRVLSLDGNALSEWADIECLVRLATAA